jgi:pimeloyl-ACP methyl ester carboxylesterase
MPTAHLPTGIDLYHESHGEGEPLVLIPSTAFPADVWLPDQVPALSRELRLILLDVRGVGRSSHAQGVYTIEQMACDVIALLDHLDVPAAHLLGHSMGGRIALEAALDWPGRVKSLIMAASGSGPAGRSGPECLPGIPYRLASGLARSGFEEYVREEIVGSAVYFTDPYRASQPERVKAFFEKYVWPHHARLPEYIRLVMARQYWEATHRLGDVAVPTLVVVGSEDTGGSDHVKQGKVMAERIPGAQYKELPGQSHGYFWEAPDETNAVIRDWVLAHRAG